MINTDRHLRQIPVDKGFYIAGFVDGEGSFYLSARQRPDYPTRWRFSLHFNISNRDRAVLEICRHYLGCGTLRESRPGFYTLEVERLETIGAFIIPFFKRFGFLSNKKKAEFLTFQRAYALLQGGIRRPDELEQVLALRQQLNLQRQTRIRNTDAIIRKTFCFDSVSPSESLGDMKESSETTR